MPNHVTHHLSIHGADAPNVIKRIAGTESTFDFHKVISMPEELNIEESSDGRMGLAAISGRCDEFLSYQWVKEVGFARLPSLPPMLNASVRSQSTLHKNTFPTSRCSVTQHGTGGVMTIGEQSGMPTR